MEKTQACIIKISHKKQTLEYVDKFKILQMIRIIFLTIKLFILYSNVHTISFFLFEIYFEMQNLSRQWSQL